MKPSILTIIAVALSACSQQAVPTYRSVYENAKGTPDEKHKAATDYCLNNTCLWGSR